MQREATTVERRDFFGGALGVTAGAALAPREAFAGKAGAGAGSALVAAHTAPSKVKNAADFVCDGSSDQTVINDAIKALGSRGGAIRLSRGVFNVTGAVRLKRRTTLAGEGRATVLRANGSWAAYDGTGPGAIVEPRNQGIDKTTVMHLALDGNRGGGANVRGMYFRITDAARFDEGPDPTHMFSHLYIFDTESHGIHLSGGRMRATKLSNIRVYNAGGQTEANGFRVECPDGSYHQCETGSSSGDGFYIAGTNNRFTNCKSWYSDGSGFFIKTPRNQFAACDSQDNEQHGFYINSGPNSLTSCHADSNSWRGSSPQSRYDGFHIPWSTEVQIIGCSAYDKNESNRGSWQRFGVFVGGASENCQLIVTTNGNASGALGGSGAANASNVVMVTG